MSVICANSLVLNPALRNVMNEMVWVPNPFNAVLIVLWGILRYILERIIRFEVLINFLIVTVFIYKDIWT